MSDSSPLLASLLMGQRQEENPFQAQRKFGRQLITAGSSTAPLGSGNPLEGLARALQAGIGGLTAGYADQQEKDQNQFNVGLMSDAAKAAFGDAPNKIAPDPMKAADILKGLKGNGYEQQALLSQIVQSGITTGLANQAAGAQITAGGYGAPAAPQGAPAPVPAGNGTIPAAWAPHIQTAAAATGLPPQLIQSQAQVESGGNANAVSPAGSQGPMQLQPGTARDLGVANPFDPKTAIPGGAAYLKQQVDKYGNLDHALAAYNWGPGNVDKWLAAGGNPAQLPQETQAYIAKVKAGMQGGVPQGQPGNVPPMQIPVAQGSQEGTILRQQAERLKAAGQTAAALPLFKQADIEDGKNADIRANRDVPGTPTGNMAILNSVFRNPAIANTKEYAAAHAQVYKPVVSMEGGQYYPDSTAHPAPGGGPGQPARFVETPGSQFKIAQDLSKQYGEDQAIKNWRTIEPVIASMRDSVAHPSKAADLQLASGLATIYSPQGGGGLPRGEMLKKLADVESLPAEIRTAIKSAISGQGMDAESRARIMAEAESRAGAHKQQFDAVTQQYQQRGAKYGIRPEDFMTGPASSQQQAPAESAPKVRNFNPSTGRLE